MAKVFHHTGMPPTTLFRWIVSLEQKSLIQTTKLGKLRRLQITEKFLGKNISSNEIGNENNELVLLC